MGRVSRYKKVKESFQRIHRHVDPDNKSAVTASPWGILLVHNQEQRKMKKRSRTSEKLRAQRGRPSVRRDDFDAPPSDHEDDFDLKDVVGSLKKKAPPKEAEESDRSSTVKNFNDEVNQPNAITNGTESSASASIGKPSEPSTTAQPSQEFLEEQLFVKTIATASKNNPTYSRQEHESKKEYKERIKALTRPLMKKTTSSSVSTSLEASNSSKKQRRKEFLQNKKRSKKRKAYDVNASEFDDDDIEYKDETPAFGEQADRPPIFLQLPRGAHKKKRL